MYKRLFFSQLLNFFLSTVVLKAAYKNASFWDVGYFSIFTSYQISLKQQYFMFNTGTRVKRWFILHFQNHNIINQRNKYHWNHKHHWTEHYCQMYFTCIKFTFKSHLYHCQKCHDMSIKFRKLIGHLFLGTKNTLIWSSN